MMLIALEMAMKTRYAARTQSDSEVAVQSANHPFAIAYAQSSIIQRTLQEVIQQSLLVDLDV